MARNDVFITDLNRDGELEWKDFDLARQVCSSSIQ